MKKILSLVLALCMVLSIMPAVFAAETEEAERIEALKAELAAITWYNPEASEYRITNEADLWSFAKAARLLAELDVEPFSGKTVYLAADIDLKWQEWYPINF